MKKFQPLTSRRSTRKLGELNGFVEEILSGQQTIKIYIQEEPIIERFDRKNQSHQFPLITMQNIIGIACSGPVNFINNVSLMH